MVKQWHGRDFATLSNAEIKQLVDEWMKCPMSEVPAGAIEKVRELGNLIGICGETIHQGYTEWLLERKDKG